jgi:peptidyl-prolyl cis-trans isomerase SurA
MKNKFKTCKGNICIGKPIPLLVIALIAIMAHSLIMPQLSVKAQTTNSVAQGIAAVVNDDIISQLDLDNRIQFIIFSARLQNNKNTVKKITGQVLRGLINDKLKIQEAKRLGVSVTQAELESSIRMIEKKNGLLPGKMETYLAKQKVNFGTFELQVNAEVAWKKAVIKQTRSTIKIGNDAIDEAIFEIEKNKGKLEYFVAEIFIPFDPNKSTDETYQAIARLYSQAEQGAKFSALARSFSQSASAANGGNLGWIRIDQVDTNLANIITLMEKGSTTKPVRGAEGYYILRLLDKRRSLGLPIETMKVSIQQVFVPLGQNKSTGGVNAKRNLAKQISSSINTCSGLAQKGVELGSKESGRLEVTDTSKLPKQIQSVVTNIPLSKASEPIQISTGFLVMMVCKRSGGGIVANVRNRMRNILLQKRASLMSRRMLRNVTRAAFLDIR